MHSVRLNHDSELVPHEVLIGGPPCQPFSVGEQAGRHDARDMVPVFVAQLKRHQPALAIMENVANLCGRKHAGYLRDTIKEMEDAGYTVDYRVLNAADYGVRKCASAFLSSHIEVDSVFLVQRIQLT